MGRVGFAVVRDQFVTTAAKLKDVKVPIKSANPYAMGIAYNTPT